MPHTRTPPISLKTYRHFAVVTVAITLTMAVFADGETRQAMADRVAERERAAELQEAQVAKFGKPKLIQRTPTRRSDWGQIGYGDTFDQGYGMPTDRTGQFARTTAVWRGRVGNGGAVPGAYAPYGVSPEEWAGMSEEEREAYLQKRAAPPVAVTAERRQRQVDDLMAASAARAGTASDPSD